MTKGEGNLYYASFPATYDMCVFSDNKANQTGDITMPSYQNALYSNGSWSEVQGDTTQPTDPTQPDTGDKVLLGDADGDGKVTILDATYIQRKLASLPVESYNALAADTDEDGEITILDATYIQRYLAGLSCPEGIGKPIA